MNPSLLGYPLVNIQKNYGKSPFSMGKPLYMAMFNSYVSLPEGIFQAIFSANRTCSLGIFCGRDATKVSRRVIVSLYQWEFQEPIGGAYHKAYFSGLSISLPRFPQGFVWISWVFYGDAGPKKSQPKWFFLFTAQWDNQTLSERDKLTVIQMAYEIVYCHLVI